MTRIIAMLTGNPMIMLWIVLASFAAGAASGGSAAWWIQGLKITSVEQEFTAYQQSIKAQELQHEIAAAQQRQDAAMEYAAQQGVLNHEIEKGIVYRRCVAAGKCGARVLQPTSCSPSVRLPPAGGTDGGGSNAVPAAGEPAAEDGSEAPEVVSDCAVTTLRLNRLQNAIERQDGY